MQDQHTRGLLEHAVPLLARDVRHLLAVLVRHLRQDQGVRIAALGTDEVRDGLHFGRVDEAALQANQVIARRQQHVTAADELVGPASVEDGPAVDLRGHAEGHAAGEVGLDGAGDDVDRRALRGDDQVNADGPRQLRQTCNGHLHLLARRHDQVGKLVDDEHDVRQVAVAVLRIQLAPDKLGVVLLEVAALGILEQLVPLVHFEAQRLDGPDHLAVVGDDRLFAVRQLGEVVALDVVEEGQFHLLRIHQDKLELARVLLVEQGDQHRVEAHGFTLTGGTGHEHVRHLGQVEDVRLVGDGLSNGDGQGRIAVLELVAGNERPHADDVRIRIRHLDANRAPAGNRRDDPDAECGETQGDVVFEVLDLGDPNAGRRHQFIQGHRGADGRLDARDFDAVVLQRVLDALLVGLEFFGAHFGLAGTVGGEEVNVGQLKPADVQRGIVFAKGLNLGIDLVLRQGGLLFRHFHFHGGRGRGLLLGCRF